MKKDIENQFHGYHQRYDVCGYIQVRGNWKNGKPINYHEVHYMKKNLYFIR